MRGEQLAGGDLELLVGQLPVDIGSPGLADPAGLEPSSRWRDDDIAAVPRNDDRAGDLPSVCAPGARLLLHAFTVLAARRCDYPAVWTAEPITERGTVTPAAPGHVSYGS